MKQVLILIFSVCLILFVLVPAAFIFLGTIDNPLAIRPLPGMTPTYRNGQAAGNIQSSSKSSLSAQKKESSIFDLWQSETAVSADAQAVNCQIPARVFEPHVRDARLARDEVQSIVSSAEYEFRTVLEGPVYDWQYTEGVLKDEVASFVFDEKIIHMLARKVVPECFVEAQEVYDEFHRSEAGVEYFSSRAYLDQVKGIGVTRALLRTFGSEKINGKTYHWYMLDETFAKMPTQTISTIWYSTQVGGVEYWFGFSGYIEGGVFLKSSLDEFARDVLEATEFKSVL